MIENPFLPLSFIAGPAILTNACAVLLNGASIRYNLAIQLWRDLQSEAAGHHTPGAAPYQDRMGATMLARRRIVLLVSALNLLYGAVGGFGFSTLTGLVGALTAGGDAPAIVSAAKAATVLAGGVGLLCLLAAAGVFILESRCTIGLLRLGTPAPHRATAAPDTGAI